MSTRLLRASPALLEALARYRCLYGLDRAPEVKSSSVVQTERAIGQKIGAPLLTVFAGMARDPKEIVRFHEDAVEMRLPEGLFAFDRDPVHAFFWCSSGPVAGERIVAWPRLLFKSAPAILTLDAYVDRFLLPSVRKTKIDQPMSPAILRFEAGLRLGAWVSHPRFGGGWILRRSHDHLPRALVDFGEHGEKWIVESYLTAEQSPPSQRRRSA